MCQDPLTASVWKTLPVEIKVQLCHPNRRVLLDSRVHSIGVKNAICNPSNKKSTCSTTKVPYPFLYPDIPVEVEHLDTDHGGISDGNSTEHRDAKPVATSPFCPLINTNITTLNTSAMTKPPDTIFDLNRFSEYEQTFSLKCLQLEAKPPHFILFNDGLFIRLTTQKYFRFWPIELIWIEMDEKRSDSEFEIQTPEGVYKLVSSLWHAVLLKTVRYACSSRDDLFVIRSGTDDHNDDTIDCNSLREQRCCLYHLFRSGPLEGFAYYGSWLNGELFGSGKMCWPAKNFNTMYSRKNSTHSNEQCSSETPSHIFHLQNENNDTDDLSCKIPDSVRLFLAFIGPLDICVKNIENKVISIFCDGEFQSNQLDGLGELCIQTTQGSINVRAEWKNGRPHGIGSLRYMNGDIYTGWFVNGTREGHGCQETFPLDNLRYPKQCYRRNEWSTVYSGNWLADKQDGFGILKDTTNGDVYVGQWLKGVMCGRGILHQTSGIYVAGEFQANGINGQGLCVTPEGNIYTGMLAKNQPKGKAILSILSSNLLLVGKFSGTLGNRNHKTNSTNSPPKDDTLYFKGSIIPSDRVMNKNRITSGSCHHRLRVPFLVQNRMNGSWKRCDRIEAVLNEISTQNFESSVNKIQQSQLMDAKTISHHDYVEIAILILSYSVPFHLRWESLFQNCIINTSILLRSTSKLGLTDCITSLSPSISLENASYDMVNSHVSSFHHIELIAELAYWCLPSSLGGFASTSIDELLCHLLNELHSHEIHASSSSLKCPKSSPLWLKYLQLISSLLGDCFHHILCIINDKNVSSNHSSGVNQVLHNSPLNDLIHAYLVIGLTECAHVITRLAHTFAQAIQFKLNSLSVTLVNQIDNVNYLFQVCEPNTNCDLFPSPNDTNMDADKADEQVSNTNDHPYQCDQNCSEDEEKNDIAKAEWRFLCNLPEVQLSGSISLFELACDCLLPNIYPTLFGLFKAQYSMLDQSYWIYCQALHCKSDSILYSYLELDQNLWLWEPSSSSESTLPLSERYSAFHPAVDILRKLSQKITPTEKLLIIYQTFATVDHIVSKSELSRHPTQETSDESHSCRNLSICSVDTLLHLPGLDQLLPIIQFVVIRAGIMYLGAELAYIEQLAPERLSLTGLLPYLMTTMQACYDQILREGSQFTIQF